ncbi:MAG: 16S rRNA (uracil(1498)-N(3))-methyltransferase [Rikenellaceae bacterium]|nr:16S rRNA (uracil(1498)-N(3))-methyltransferase [Rikenellaceae bacterium]
MQLFYAPEITLPEYTLPEEESRHCEKVLRKVVGDTLHLTDGVGTIYTARILSTGKRCTVRIEQQTENFEQRPYHLTMAVAPTKNIDRFEWFAEKATEVGIDRIIPIECEHSERRIIKCERIDKIVVSAMKQSLKAYKPEVAPMTPLKKVIEMPFEGKRLIAHCEKSESRQLLKDVVKAGDNVLLLIGPEGDFSMSEIEAARKAGFIEVSLGEMRLRTETAALTGVIHTSFINL